jgi:hypothetical protein
MFSHSDSVGAVIECEVSLQVSEADVDVFLPWHAPRLLQPFGTPE